MSTQSLITFEQFMDLPEQDAVRRELDEGRLIEMPNPGAMHSVVQGKTFSRLQIHCDRTGADFHVLQNVDFRLGPDITRAPDVCLVRKPAYAAMQKVRGALVGAPDLAVEVVSPSDTAEDIDRKIEQYLAAGAAAVWVFYPETRHIRMDRRSGETRKISGGQKLEEPELLPGFSLPLEEVFAGLEELRK